MPPGSRSAGRDYGRMAGFRRLYRRAPLHPHVPRPPAIRRSIPPIRHRRPGVRMTITTTAELEDVLSCPTEADIAAMRALEGDLLILGAAGKMGPSLAARAQRAIAAAGVSRRVIAVTRSGQQIAPGVEP